MDLEYLKRKLLAEKTLLESELRGIATQSSFNPNDWDAMPPTRGEVDTRDEIAERMEDYDERKAAELVLEKQLEKVNNAIIRMENGTYAKCIICGKEIDEERLKTVPSAKTCKKHWD